MKPAQDKRSLTDRDNPWPPPSEGDPCQDKTRQPRVHEFLDGLEPKTKHPAPINELHNTASAEEEAAKQGQTYPIVHHKSCKLTT